MLELPKFGGFKLTVTQADVDKANTRTPALEPGEHTLEILDIEYKGTVAADDTWHKFMLTLGRPGTEKSPDGKFKGCVRNTVMVPSVDIHYNNKLGLFNLLVKFFDGIGEHLTVDSLEKLVARYFSDLKTLKGLKLKVVIGYKGNYVKYKDGRYSLVTREGQPLVLSAENDFGSRDAAKGQALTDNIEIQDFIEVVNILPGELQLAPPAKKSKAKADW